MKKKIIILLLVGPPLLFGAIFLYALYEGPRMTVQHHLRDYQMTMPAPVAGTVTVAPAAERVPAAADVAKMKNPLQADTRTLASAAVYYTYYCVFCHGDRGAGDGPVGNSYIPRPADLRSAKVSGYSDGDLLRASLTGIGHEPVLERVVPPEHRWHLVLFVRSLAQAK